MLDNNYDAAASVKRIADIIQVIGFLFGALCISVCFAVLMADASWIIAVSLLVVGGGAMIGAIVLYAILMGYGEIIENTRILAEAALGDDKSTADEDLPEI